MQSMQLTTLDSKHLDAAHKLATEAHFGQRDLEGAPYIFHPLRVGLAQSTVAAKIGGFLHDVIEDSAMVTLVDIESQFGAAVCDIVRAVTLRGREPYQAFIARIIASGNIDAVNVKIADIIDNLDNSRLARLSFETQQRLRRKYEPALAMLLAARDRI